jgi:hypothetical protein
MMKVISDIDLRVTTLGGTAVLLQAGVARAVGDEIGLLAIQMGAKNADEPVATHEIVIDEPLITKHEEEALVGVMNDLIDSADPENFKSDGTPKAAVVNKAAGRTVALDEREQAWEQALNS